MHPFHKIEEAILSSLVDKVYNMCNKYLATNVPSMQSMAYTLGNTAAKPGCCKAEPVPKKEEGKNPMRYDAVTVAPSIQIDAPAPVSEVTTQREYLNKRLHAVYRSFEFGDKFYELRKFFNIGVQTGPKNFRELIAAIKADEFTIDKKVEKRLDRMVEDRESDDYNDFDDDFCFTPMDGINFTKFPEADWEGHRKAVEEMNKVYQDTKDTIAISDPKDGLAALKAFEAWWPTKATDTAQ